MGSTIGIIDVMASIRNISGVVTKLSKFSNPSPVPVPLTPPNFEIKKSKKKNNSF